MHRERSERSVLILFAHPALEHSRVNRPLVDAVRELPGVTFHDLYEAYPDFEVDVAAEQALLTAHDTIVLQHPFYWYGAPALIKQWEDLVLEHGWAYGTGGTALEGKRLVVAITTGGSEQTYCREGDCGYSIAELLRPVEQSFRLCGMDYLPPFVVHGTHKLDSAAVAAHAADYCRSIEALRDRRFDFERLRGQSRLNSDLDRSIVN